MKPYTVVTAIHPDIAKEIGGDRIEHYTSLLYAKDIQRAGLAGCKEHYRTVKDEFEAFRESLKLDTKPYYPAKIILLLVFEGHQDPVTFGWVTGMQPKDADIIKPKRRKT